MFHSESNTEDAVPHRAPRHAVPDRGDEARALVPHDDAAIPAHRVEVGVAHARGGEHASTAKQITSRVLLKLQSRDGSWNTRGGNEGEGGKIYATSMALLSLSVHHNYLPIYQR